jgi:hypothetical protein
LKDVWIWKQLKTTKNYEENWTEPWKITKKTIKFWWKNEHNSTNEPAWERAPRGRATLAHAIGNI